MIKSNHHIVLCGGSILPRKLKKISSNHIQRLCINPNDNEHNINLELPHFVRAVNCHFPDRIKDLLEIAGYVYAADRMIGRGSNDSLEYHSWSRELQFIIKVRDADFWGKPEISQALSEAL